MRKSAPQTVTSLPPSPDEERRSRMIKYTVMMGIRVVCFLVIFLLPGYWRIIPAIGVIVLPYLAVVVANTVRSSVSAEPERPGGLVRTDYHDDPGGH